MKKGRGTPITNNLTWVLQVVPYSHIWYEARIVVTWTLWYSWVHHRQLLPLCSRVWSPDILWHCTRGKPKISSTSDLSRPLTAFSCLLSLNTWIFGLWCLSDLCTFKAQLHYQLNLWFNLVLGEVAQHLLLGDEVHLLAQLLLQPACKLPCCCALPTAWQTWW